MIRRLINKIRLLFMVDADMEDPPIPWIKTNRPLLFRAFTAGARLGLEGEKYLPPLSTSMVVLYGSPETLLFENVSRLTGRPNTLDRWVAYFPEGDFTIEVDKRTDRIVRTWEGRRAR